MNPMLNLIKSLARRMASATPAVSIALLSATTTAFAQANLPVIQIQADKVTAKMPPTFYGLMTEEINFAYEGGLYAELIRNRTFKSDSLPQPIKPENYDPAKYYPAKYPANAAPKFWNSVGGATLVLDANTPLNDALNVSLKVGAAAASKATPAGVANGGYWGIPVEPKTTYKVSFFAKAAPGFTGRRSVTGASPGLQTSWDISHEAVPRSSTVWPDPRSAGGVRTSGSRRSPS